MQSLSILSPFNASPTQLYDESEKEFSSSNIPDEITFFIKTMDSPDSQDAIDAIANRKIELTISKKGINRPLSFDYQKEAVKLVLGKTANTPEENLENEPLINKSICAALCLSQNLFKSVEHASIAGSDFVVTKNLNGSDKKLGLNIFKPNQSVQQFNDISKNNRLVQLVVQLYNNSNTLQPSDVSNDTYEKLRELAEFMKTYSDYVDNQKNMQMNLNGTDTDYNVDGVLKAIGMLDLSDVPLDVAETISHNIQAVRKQLWQAGSLNRSSELGNLIVIKQNATRDALEIEDRCKTEILRKQVDQAEELRTRPLDGTILRLSTYETRDDREINDERFYFHESLMLNNPTYLQRSFSEHTYDAKNDTVTSTHGHHNVHFDYRRKTGGRLKVLGIRKATFISKGGHGTQSFTDYKNPRTSFRSRRIADRHNKIEVEIAV